MASKKLSFRRIASGLYINHEYGVTLSRDLVWSKAEGRKWTVKYSVSSYPGLAPNPVERRADSYAEARDIANRAVEMAR